MASSRPLRIVGFIVSVLLLIFLLLLPHHASDPQVRLWGKVLYFAIAAMGLNLLTGYNGQVSIGHGAFFGIGAYTSAILIHSHGWTFLPTLLIAGPLCFVVGVLIGFPALRVKGLYLALVTLGLAVVFPELVTRYVPHELCKTCGTNQVAPTTFERAPVSWIPEWLSRVGRDDQWAYYVALMCALIGLVVAFLIIRSRFGRAMIAVRDHEAAAETVGINIAQVKVVAFGVSALYAGIAGSCSVLIDKQAAATAINTFTFSILFLVAVVIGGTATVVGPLVGAFIVVFVQHIITDILPSHVENLGVVGRTLANPAASPAIFGILLILFVFVMPDGIVGGLKRLWAALVRRRHRSPVAPPPAASPLTAST
jgi:branched-chain amino acid transport system permease protein